MSIALRIVKNNTTSSFSLSKNYPNLLVCDIIITDGGILYGTMEKRRTARANHCRFGGPGSKRPSSSEDRKGYGLRVVIRAPGSVLLPRQWASRNRSGRAHKNGADSEPVWNPFRAADLPGNPGECCISVVSGVRAAGQYPAFCHGELCLLQVESIRKTELGKRIYAQRKETIERVFADAKEKHAMRYTHHRGLAAVTRWVRLKYAAMNLKKLAQWSWKNSTFFPLFAIFIPVSRRTPAFVV